MWENSHKFHLNRANQRCPNILPTTLIWPITDEGFFRIERPNFRPRETPQNAPKLWPAAPTYLFPEFRFLHYINRCRPEQNSSLQTETVILRQTFRFTFNVINHIFFQSSFLHVCSEFPCGSCRFLCFAMTFEFVILWPKTWGILSKRKLKFQSAAVKRRLRSAAVNRYFFRNSEDHCTL